MARRLLPAKYRPAVITFVDILGFREIVHRRGAEDVHRILGRLRSFAAREDGSAEGEHTRAFSFSDSVIRVRFFDSEYSSGALFHEALSLVHAQGELISDGILLRGGMTTGDVHVEDNAIFGPGFIRAYGLESEFANYPRIVVGPEAFADLRSDARLHASHHDLVDEIHYLRRLLRRADDGLWFVDYLKAFRAEMDEPELYPEILMSHRASIVAGAAESHAPRVLQKYLWMALYHNQVCQEFGYDDEFMLTTTDIPFLEALSERSPDIADDD
ncbi:hypothetical protein [Xanthobacter flavus]|uniref:hypothetical protein n=1 Tax=Xanthobacter flavus TaxID=281 RepID=UPI00372BFCFA